MHKCSKWVQQKRAIKMIKNGPVVCFDKEEK